MKLAFYKAFQGHALLADKIIAIGTFGKYSHVEMIFDNGESFSISPRDAGSRYKNIQYHPDHWDIYELSIPARQEELMRAIIDKNYLYKTYDYTGAIFSAFPFCIEKKNKLFCSEVTVNVLRRFYPFDFFGAGCKYSPNGLHRTLSNNYNRYRRSKDVYV